MNYCRQIVLALRQQLDVPNASDRHARAQHLIDLANASQKFLLPVNGRFFDDPSLKGLDAACELRLPFPFVALEWRSEGTVAKGQGRSSKRVVFVREDQDSAGYRVLRITIACFVDSNGTWAIVPDIGLPVSKWHLGMIDGRVALDVRRSSDRVQTEDVIDEASAVLAFLNALACSNVRAERLPQRDRTRKAKTAIPFDEYHVLTIGSAGGATESGSGGGASHRSPREHLRRGHIRRYESGIKVWVNATVVNPGVGGKVVKDYEVRA